MKELYSCFLQGGLIVLAVALFFALLRAIRGPRVADRMMGINMVGSLSLLAIAILAVLLKQNWLLDVSIIYGMISFLAVVVLAKVLIADKGREDDQDE